MLIDINQVSHDFGVLVLHLIDFIPPLDAFLILLLDQEVTLLFNAHLLELEHLNFVIDMLSFHGAKFDLAFNLIHLSCSWLRDNCLLLQIECFLAVLTVITVTVVNIVVIVFITAFDVLVIGQLLS